MSTQSLSASRQTSTINALYRQFLDSSIALKVAAGAIILSVWEAVVRTFGPAYVTTPTGVVRAFPKVIVDPDFLSKAVATMEAVIVGLAIAIALGTIVGLLMGRIKEIRYALSHYVNSLFTMPMIAVLPLLSLWFGHTSATRLVFVVLVAFLSIVVNVTDGARGISEEYLEVARAFRVGKIRTMFDIVLPMLVPHLIAGVRLAAGRALTAAVIADFFLAIPGLGYYILFNSRNFHLNEAFVAVVVLIVAGVGFDRLINWITTSFMPWLRRD
ncbi:MAG TPA: ABC transporter permease subunit [Pseudolabrys sp.]|jgi:NitT/TauT family transport system permease protein|nr:ABC transporter permease subunit [Pseudolabrys sp.]HVU21772.1 ABC transporter permease subunit [Rhizomicrobium sp.]